MGTTTHLMTAEELFWLPDDGLRHELIKGELLTMPPLGEEHGAVTMNLSILLAQYVKSRKLGRMYAAETGFKLESDPDTVMTVWLVDPQSRTVEVCKADGEKKLFTVEDEITGDSVVPGFRCRVTEIFD